MNFYTKIAIFSSFFLLLFHGCIRETKPTQNTTKLRISINNAPILQYADDASRPLTTLGAGDTVLYCNEITDFSTKRLIYGVTMQEPWLKVQTADGTVGWLYAAMVQFDALADSQLAGQVLKPRFEHFFGKRLTNRVSTFNRRYDNVSTQEAMATIFREGKGLQDSLQGVLQRRIAADSVLLDMFWMRGMVRGMTTEFCDDRTRYEMAYDFHAWHRHAFGTRGEADEHFMKVMLVLYADGLQHRIRTWQQCDKQQCPTPLSRLGSSTHLKILTACDAALGGSKCFESELLSIKTELINDITEGDAFAQPSAAVQAEIMDILATPLPNLLQEADRSAMDARLKILRQTNYKKLAIR